MLIILNPIANNSKATKTQKEIKKKLQALNMDFELVHSEYPSHGRELAKEAALSKKYDIIVAAGGDGTAHDVSMGLFDSGLAPVDLPKAGFLPVGTANDFCLTLGVSLDLDKAIEIIIQENVAYSNAVLCQGDDQPPHYCINAGQVGLISAVGYANTVLKEKPIFPFNIPPISLLGRGPRKYTLIALKYILWKYSNVASTIQIDDQEPRKIKLVTLAFGVGKTMGHYPFCPHAELYGDTFAMCLGDGLSKIDKLKLVSQLKKGNYENVELLEAKKTVLKLEEPLPGDSDGEAFAVNAINYTFELKKKMLKVLVP
ncbi:MAG: diacylglycerol/lipid kinase family protein [Candidatus Kariarchaeaceae archaeon]